MSKHATPSGGNVINAVDLHKVYQLKGREVVALRGVSLHVPQGEIYGVVGRAALVRPYYLRKMRQGLEGMCYAEQ